MTAVEEGGRKLRFERDRLAAARDGFVVPLQPCERPAPSEMEVGLFGIEGDRAIVRGKRFVVVHLLEQRVAVLEHQPGRVVGLGPQRSRRLQHDEQKGTPHHVELL